MNSVRDREAGMVDLMIFLVILDLTLVEVGDIDNVNRPHRMLTYHYVYHSNNCIWEIPSRWNMSDRHCV